MRNLVLTSVASIALFGSAFVSTAFSATPNIVVTAGQGGSFAIRLPAPTQTMTPEAVAARQERRVEVSTGNGGAVSTFVPADNTVTTPEREVASVDGE